MKPTTKVIGDRFYEYEISGGTTNNGAHTSHVTGSKQMVTAVW